MFFNSTIFPFWYEPSQVMISFDWLSSMRPCSESTEKPPNTTEWIAPIFAHANIAKTISGTRPM